MNGIVVISGDEGVNAADFLKLARATLTFMSNRTVQYVIAGDVTDEELDAMIAAGGGEVPGFSVCLS